MAADKDQTAWTFSFPSIDGGAVRFADFKGRVLLVTNTASFCGYTYQYEGLKKLHAAKSPIGLTVIGVPSQDFNQESADNAAVKAFCETRFDIDFPLTGISHVRGAQSAPFYAWVNIQKQWQPSWNFNKVLVSRDGRIAGTFGSGDEPDGPVLTRAIDAELTRTL
ncbi:MAG: glutathione peroxidase [Acetobacteraceae bacterium]|jgi:glutathione peroxidase|nr:glutathione peroxidase [Acetobacteraceae bacterium]